MRRDVALCEHRRALGVESRRKEHRGEVERSLAEVVRHVIDGDRVEGDDAEERVAEFLCGRVLPKAAAVVAEMLGACRLDAGEDAHGSILSREDEKTSVRRPRDERSGLALPASAGSRSARGATTRAGCGR